MTDGNIFRLVVVVMIAIFGPLAFYHRLRSATDEKLDRWQEGIVILLGLRLSAVPVFVSGVVWLIDPQWMAWSSIVIPVGLRWLGVVLAGCSGLLVVWTFRNLGKNLTDTVVTRRDHTLVTTGPYRYVRHPFYLAFALGVVGGSLVLANWCFFVAGLLPLGFLMVRTRIEEDKLIARFGTDYQEYQQRVGQFLPRFRR